MVLGVNGLTGGAIAAEFAEATWDVVGTGRCEARFPTPLRDRGVSFVRSDRYDPVALGRALADGADVVVDCLCYTAEHARQLLHCSGSFGSAVMLSSKAVYVDSRGRHGNSDDPPDFASLVPETQPVMVPDYSGAFDSREGYGANKVAAELALLDSCERVSILRPSRIHGPGAARPRKWFVVKRILDGRTSIPLAHGGMTGNHPTAAVNLARLARVCAEHPGQRVLNAADPSTPTARDIVTAIATACGQPIEIVGLDHDAPSQFGWTPWASWPPVFLDTTASTALGYQPAGTYSDTVTAAVTELWSLPGERLERLARDSYFAGRFDYGLDDAALAAQ